jgi:hypothetical protein
MSDQTYYVPTPGEIEKWWHHFVDSLFDERPLACVLIATAYVDAALAALLLKHFVRSNTAAPRLLDSERGGHLGSFHVRTEVAYCLGLISGKMQANLNKIGEIRNIFAHGFDRSVDFTTDRIVKKCRDLHVPPMSMIFGKRKTLLFSVSGEPAVDEKGDCWQRGWTNSIARKVRIVTGRIRPMTGLLVCQHAPMWRIDLMRITLWLVKECRSTPSTSGSSRLIARPPAAGRS